MFSFLQVFAHVQKLLFCLHIQIYLSLYSPLTFLCWISYKGFDVTYIVHGEKSNKISHPSTYYNKKYYIVAATYSLPTMPTGMKGSNKGPPLLSTCSGPACRWYPRCGLGSSSLPLPFIVRCFLSYVWLLVSSIGLCSSWLW